MAENRILNSTIEIDGYLYDITAKKVAKTLTIKANGVGEVTFDGSDTGTIEIPAVPTKVSELTNDTGYITEDELTAKGYVTGSYVDSQVAGIAIPTVPTKVSEFENDMGYLTQHQSLAGYATKDDIKNFITEVPADYVTEEELKAKGYLTQHQSLDGYATETFVTDKIEEAKLEGKDIDLSGYATKDELANKTIVPAAANTVKVSMDNEQATYATITISKDEPDGGVVGDIWFKYSI